MALQILTETAKPFFYVLLLVKIAVTSILKAFQVKSKVVVCLLFCKRSLEKGTFHLHYFTLHNTIILKYHYYNQALQVSILPPSLNREPLCPLNPRLLTQI